MQTIGFLSVIAIMTLMFAQRASTTVYYTVPEGGRVVLECRHNKVDPRQILWIKGKLGILSIDGEDWFHFANILDGKLKDAYRLEATDRSSFLVIDSAALDNLEKTHPTVYKCLVDIVFERKFEVSVVKRDLDCVSIGVDFGRHLTVGSRLRIDCSITKDRSPSGRVRFMLYVGDEWKGNVTVKGLDIYLLRTTTARASFDLTLEERFQGKSVRVEIETAFQDKNIQFHLAEKLRLTYGIEIDCPRTQSFVLGSTRSPSCSLRAGAPIQASRFSWHHRDSTWTPEMEAVDGEIEATERSVPGNYSYVLKISRNVVDNFTKCHGETVWLEAIDVEKTFNETTMLTVYQPPMLRCPELKDRFLEIDSAATLSFNCSIFSCPLPFIDRAIFDETLRVLRPVVRIQNRTEFELSIEISFEADLPFGAEEAKAFAGSFPLAAPLRGATGWRGRSYGRTEKGNRERREAGSDDEGNESLVEKNDEENDNDTLEKIAKMINESSSFTSDDAVSDFEFVDNSPEFTETEDEDEIDNEFLVEYVSFSNLSLDADRIATAIKIESYYAAPSFGERVVLDMPPMDIRFGPAGLTCDAKVRVRSVPFLFYCRIVSIPALDLKLVSVSSRSSDHAERIYGTVTAVGGLSFTEGFHVRVEEDDPFPASKETLIVGVVGAGEFEVMVEYQALVVAPEGSVSSTKGYGIGGDPETMEIGKQGLSRDNRKPGSSVGWRSVTDNVWFYPVLSVLIGVIVLTLGIGVFVLARRNARESRDEPRMTTRVVNPDDDDEGYSARHNSFASGEFWSGIEGEEDVKTRDSDEVSLGGAVVVERALVEPTPQLPGSPDLEVLMVPEHPPAGIDKINSVKAMQTFSKNILATSPRKSGKVTTSVNT